MCCPKAPELLDYSCLRSFHAVDQLDWWQEGTQRATGLLLSAFPLPIDQSVARYEYGLCVKGMR